MLSYFAYGMNISSDLYLPELMPVEGVADVVVRSGEVELPHSREGISGEGFVCPSSEEMYLFREDVGRILVRGGRQIIVDRSCRIDDRLLRLYILGPALAVLLHQRGWLVLHGSAVSINGEVVAFLGGSGQGKSTIAGALHARGHAVVTDDLTAVRVEPSTGVPVTSPGFPQLKLWPDSAGSMGDEAEALPRLAPRYDKRDLKVVRDFSLSTLPLKRVYVLAEGTENEVELLGPQAALLKLIDNSFCARLLAVAGAAAHLSQCASVIKGANVCILRCKRALDTLPDLARTVEQDLYQTPETGRFAAGRAS